MWHAVTPLRHVAVSGFERSTFFSRNICWISSILFSWPVSVRNELKGMFTAPGMWPDSSPARVNKKRKHEQGDINVGDERHLQETLKRHHCRYSHSLQDTKLFQVMMKIKSSMGLKRGGKRLFNFAEVKTSRIFSKLFPPESNER